MVLAALMLTACVTDNDNSATEGNVSVSVSVTDPVGVGSSRAITAANENTISNLHILAFNNETGVMLSNGYTEVDNLSNITCKLAIAGVQETQVAVYAIANLGNPAVFDDHSITLSQFENMYVKAADADGSTQGTFSLYKAGDETPVATVTNETHALMISNKAIKRLALAGVGFKLNLVRLVPKFVLNLYGNDVQLLSYRFVNMPVGDYLVGHDEDMTGTDYQSSTKVDLGSTALAENISYYGFKSYNAPISSSIITNQRDRIEGKAPATAAYLEVTACKPSEPSLAYYYRIYLGGVDVDGNPDATQFNIHRNHNYNLNIVFSSYIIDDYRAGINGDVNATIEVTPWATETRNPMDMDVVSLEHIHAIGDFLCSDGSVITPEEVSTSNKTPIAIIFSTETSDTDKAHGWYFYAMALTNVHSEGTTIGTYNWANSSSDVSGIPDLPYNTWQNRSSDMDGYTNTTYLNSTDYPAGYAAKTTYASQVTAPSNTSGWFLPSCGQWYYILVNLGGMSATPGNAWGWSNMSSTAVSNLNTILGKAGSGNYDSFGNEWCWSSSEHGSDGAYGAYFGSNGNMYFAYGASDKLFAGHVRPVIAF